jgi:hypothetical protein
LNYCELIEKVLKIFYPKVTFDRCGVEIDEPAVFVANHEDSFGPIASYLNFPIKLYPWVMYNLFEKGICARYIEEDFFKKELNLWQPLSRLISIFIESICVAIFNYIEAIPVYPNSRRIIETIVKSIEYLEAGKSLIIFPEIPDECLNRYINRFKTGFIEISRKVYHINGLVLKIYPVCIDKKKRVIKLGKPTKYDPEKSFIAEKKRIEKHLEMEITRLKREILEN